MTYAVIQRDRENFYGVSADTASIPALHWLSINHRIKYKLQCVMTHATVVGRSPAYTSLKRPESSLYIYKDTRTDFVSTKPCAIVQSSASGTFDVPGVLSPFGRRAFSIAGPAAWNELPIALIRTISSVASFKRNLKADLFSAAYNC